MPPKGIRSLIQNCYPRPGPDGLQAQVQVPREADRVEGMEEILELAFGTLGRIKGLQHGLVGCPIKRVDLVSLRSLACGRRPLPEIAESSRLTHRAYIRGAIYRALEP
jgi:hypothetical protein